MPRPRHIGRYRQIVAILARHGFGWVFADLDLRGMIPLRARLSRPPGPESRVRPAHLRLAFEELGPTFIKLGQVLSSRPDLLPPEYIDELAKLQDAVPAVPYEDIAAVFQADLGARPDAVFARFDPVPLASASIGQVHSARLPSGKDVIVKIGVPVAQVQKPVLNEPRYAGRRTERSSIAPPHWEVRPRGWTRGGCASCVAGRSL